MRLDHLLSKEPVSLIVSPVGGVVGGRLACRCRVVSGWGVVWLVEGIDECLGVRGWFVSTACCVGGCGKRVGSGAGVWARCWVPDLPEGGLGGGLVAGGWLGCGCWRVCCLRIV